MRDVLPPPALAKVNVPGPLHQYPWGVIYTSLFVVAGPPPTHPVFMLAHIEYP
jgi:hypothetical protein